MEPTRTLAGRRAKIICTLGPSTDSDEVLGQLLRCGMDGARLNLSFGTHAEHVARLERLRRVSSRHRPVAVIADLPGRKVRLGTLVDGRVQLLAGQRVQMVLDDGQPGDSGRLPLSATFFHDDMTRGDKIMLADGLVSLLITAISEDTVEAEVVDGGWVGEQTGVHVPGMVVRGSPLTNEDNELLDLAVAQEVDYLALSYITDGSEILAVRERLHNLGRQIPLIVKIERTEAFARLDGILKRADAVMIRRGDLGAQIDVTRVPLVQKEILRLARQAGVPVIIATQMLGSMIAAPTPTRAEASDVSNAIADGADGVLLSAETAVGRFPEEAVAMMSRIIVETERERLSPPERNEQGAQSFADTTAAIACQAASQTRAKLIACFTESGRTAILVAKYRPDVPVIAFCSNDMARRRLAITWGLRSDKLEVAEDVETMVKSVEERLLARNLVRPGERLVIVFGAPVGEKGHTNSLRLHEVGSRFGTTDLIVPRP